MNFSRILSHPYPDTKVIGSKNHVLINYGSPREERHIVDQA